MHTPLSGFLVIRPGLAVGFEWLGDVRVQITRDDEANEDVVTISRPNGDSVVRYDEAGKQIVNEGAETMGARGASYFDQAYMCCWGQGYTSSCYNPGQCATQVCVQWAEEGGGADSHARNIINPVCLKLEPYATCYSPDLSPNGQAPYSGP